MLFFFVSVSKEEGGKEGEKRKGIVGIWDRMGETN